MSFDIQIAGRTVAVSAEQLYGNARQHAWRRITSTVGRLAKYEQKTDRELPVIRLRTRPTLGPARQHHSTPATDASISRYRPSSS
jgi:hypothetical protein